jgi:hypothetical protein
MSTPQLSYSKHSISFCSERWYVSIIGKFQPDDCFQTSCWRGRWGWVHKWSHRSKSQCLGRVSHGRDRVSVSGCCTCIATPTQSSATAGFISRSMEQISMKFGFEIESFWPSLIWGHPRLKLSLHTEYCIIYTNPVVPCTSVSLLVFTMMRCNKPLQTTSLHSDRRCVSLAIHQRSCFRWTVIFKATLLSFRCESFSL